MKAFTDSEILNLLPQIPQWKYQTGYLKRELKFSEFTKAITFLNQVATLAESHQHHPLMTNNHNQLLIQLKTFDVEGISEKDFALADKYNLDITDYDRVREVFLAFRNLS